LRTGELAQHGARRRVGLGEQAIELWTKRGIRQRVHAGLYFQSAFLCRRKNTTNYSHFLVAFWKRPMPRRPKGRPSARLSSRKQPKQARSTELVAAILDAAVQVLAKEGAQRFTTARVAEKAGVSVGSLYQYFPNKAAILFRLQSDEWRQTSELLLGILEDVRTSPL